MTIEWPEVYNGCCRTTEAGTSAMTKLATAAGSPAIFPLAVVPGSGGPMENTMAMSGAERKARCRESNRRHRQRLRAADPEAYRAKQREYHRRSRKKSRAYSKAWGIAHKDRVRAHWAVWNAMRTGRLVPQPCEICGDPENPLAHHDDYSKRLDVRWLCPTCHQNLHAAARRAAEHSKEATP